MSLSVQASQRSDYDQITSLCTFAPPPQDDIIDDMEKIIAAGKCLQERGAYRIYVVATHGIFGENSCELLSQSPITEV